MLQSEQATAGDREQLNRATMAQGQMALSAAAQISEQIRQQQMLTMRAQEGKQRSAMLAVKQQLFQQQLQNAGAILQLKQQQSQAQMMQAEASRMRAELEGQHQQAVRYKMTGPIQRNGKWIGLQDPRAGTYGEISEEEAQRQGKIMQEERTGKGRQPSIGRRLNDIRTATKGLDTIGMFNQLATEAGISDAEIEGDVQRQADSNTGPWDAEKARIRAILNILRKRNWID